MLAIVFCKWNQHIWAFILTWNQHFTVFTGTVSEMNIYAVTHSPTINILLFFFSCEINILVFTHSCKINILLFSVKTHLWGCTLTGNQHFAGFFLVKTKLLFSNLEVGQTLLFVEHKLVLTFLIINSEWKKDNLNFDIRHTYGPSIVLEVWIWRFFTCFEYLAFCFVFGTFLNEKYIVA